MNGKNAQVRMQKSLDHFMTELSKIRGSRTNPQLIEDLVVEVYGTKMPIKQVATISVVDPTLIAVQTWDKSNVEAVKKSIEDADLGVNAMIDGSVVKVPLPPLTEERRKELVKVIGKLTEETKIAIRNIRHDILDELKETGLSEDELGRQEKEVQKVVDEFNKKIEDEFNKKENELLKV
jgi:ribosome recycling factor